MGAIRNPMEWSADTLSGASQHLGRIGRAIRGAEGLAAAPRVRTIGVEDLRAALREGFEDFLACRSDVVFVCVLYPLIGLLAVTLAYDGALAPLLFPAVSGLALIGPATAVGLYEMSRRRERGLPASWTDGFALIGAPSFGAMLALALALLAIFLIWMAAAQGIYAATLGPEAPASLGAFMADALGTQAGWAMIVLGCGVGFLFAALTLAISVVSFPLLLDREVGLVRAVATSLELARRNPRTVAIWGLIVAGGLALGAATLFLGLIVIMPVLGHATWRLYRRAVVAEG